MSVIKLIELVFNYAIVFTSLTPSFGRLTIIELFSIALLVPDNNVIPGYPGYLKR